MASKFDTKSEYRINNERTQPPFSVFQNPTRIVNKNLENVKKHDSYKDMYRKSLLSVAFSKRNINYISLNDHGLSMIEEIFNLRNLVNYQELKCYTKATSHQRPDRKKNMDTDTMPLE